MGEGLTNLGFNVLKLDVGDGKKIDHKSDEKNKLELARDKCFSRLESIGVISRVNNDQNETVVILEDSDIFTNGHYSGYDSLRERRIERTTRDIFLDYCRPISVSDEWGKESLPRILFFLFKDTRVITREEADSVSLVDGGSWRKKDIPAKDLFYLPTNKNDAFDLEKVRNSEYYFLLPQICNRWITNHPTKEDGFESDLSGVDVAVTAMIYRDGRGLRNKDGILMVDKELNEPSVRQPISARWFVSNFGSKIFEKQSPKEVLSEYGFNLVKNNLLVDDDFREVRKGEERNCVTNLGNWFDNGVVYYIGKGLRGCRVERLAEDIVLVLDNDGSIKKMFNPNLNEKLRSGLNPYLNNKGLLISQVPASVMRGLEIDSEKKVSLYGFDVNGKKSLDEENLKSLGVKLVGFLDSVNFSKEMRKEIKLDQLVSVFKQYENLEDSDKEIYQNLIKDNGLVAFKFFADRYINGGIPDKFLSLSENEPEKMRNLMETYVITIDNLDKLSDFAGQGEVEKYYIDRLISSFKYGSWGLIKAGLLVDLDESIKQMDLMSKSFRALKEVMSGNNEEWIQKELSPNKGAFWVAYKNNNDSTLHMLFRPKTVEDDVNGKSSQARWSVTYKDKQGEISYRLDLDDFGVSLDLGKGIYTKDGRSLGKLQELLKSVGYEYHIQTIINKATFRKPVMFASFVESMARTLGFSLNELKLPA